MCITGFENASEFKIVDIQIVRSKKTHFSPESHHDMQISCHIDSA